MFPGDETLTKGIGVGNYLMRNGHCIQTRVAQIYVLKLPTKSSWRRFNYINSSEIKILLSLSLSLLSPCLCLLSLACF